MSTPSEYFERLLQRLSEECLFGQAHYRLWRDLNREFKTDDRVYQAASYFFKKTIAAHLDSATLHLHRLIDRAGGAVSIEDLLRYAERHPAIFPHATPEQIARAVSEDRDRLAGLETKIKHLRKQRDKHFAHISKEYFSEPNRSVYRDFPTTYLDMYETFQVIGEILNRYRGFFKNSTMNMEFVEERGGRGLKNLLYLIQKGLDSDDRRPRR